MRDSAFLAEPPASITARADALRASLGDQGVVELDAISQTPRFVAKLDGYLSGPSAASAPQVALGYVRAHSGVFGLDAGDLAGLKLARERVTPDGVHHVVFAQTVDVSRSSIATCAPTWRPTAASSTCSAPRCASSRCPRRRRR